MKTILDVEKKLINKLARLINTNKVNDFVIAVETKDKELFVSMVSENGSRLARKAIKK